MYPLQMYRTEFSKNCCYASFNFLIKIGCAPKNTIIAHRKRPTPLLVWLLIVTCFHNNFFSSNLYFPLSNQPRMCRVNMKSHGCNPKLVLLYFIRLFFRVDVWNKVLPYVCFVLHIIHHNICRFTRSIGKLSLIAKKTQ
jgi:hypothetical protein